MKLFCGTMRHNSMRKITFNKLMTSMNLHPMYMTAKEYAMLKRKYKNAQAEGSHEGQALWDSLKKDMTNMKDKYERKHSFEKFLEQIALEDFSKHEIRDLGHKFEESKMFYLMGLTQQGEKIWEELEQLIKSKKAVVVI